MAETAVGLFHSASEANHVVVALQSNGIPASAIRTATGTHEASAAGGLKQELLSMGASEAESSFYVSGVTRGHAVVFVTGSSEQTAVATAVMNDHFAIDVEELAGTGEIVTEEEPGPVGGPNVTEKIEHHRNRTEGAKIFAW